MSAFYGINLAGLAVTDACLFWYQRARTPSISLGLASQANASTFLRRYLIAYLLASAGDWLQGPHIYAIYKYDKELEELTVATLYATGFVSGAISATFVGQYADKYGRKKACTLYCMSYIACCLSMLSNDFYVLLAGRVFGGLSTTLLYSVFEAWMITEYHRHSLAASGLTLGTVFGRQTSLNSVVAIVAGVVGELIVDSTGTRASPFLCACVVLVGAAIYIHISWDENYGATDISGLTSSVSAITDAAKSFWKDKRLLALGTASAIFESMMYLFIFFWSAAIAGVRKEEGAKGDPPFGLIFSCFMCAMMSGGIIFTLANDNHNIHSAGYILKFAMIFASFCLLSTVLTAGEDLYFWAFCMIELCVGLYFPSMSFLKSTIIEDGARAKIYGLMRMPLNIIVVFTHSLAAEGDQHRHNVFLSFAAALLFAYVVVQRYID